MYNAVKRRKQLQALIPVDGTLWMVIQLWQVFLVMAKLRPENFAKTIISFRSPQDAELWISYDASLTGVGFIIREVDPSTAVNPYHHVMSAVS